MSLLTQRNFLPLFLAQVLGVFNDNVFKSAMTMLVTYRLATESGLNAGVMVSLGGGIFMLPYVLFSGLAGQLADKYEKTVQIQWIKLAELLMMSVGLFVLLDGHIWGLFILLFLMGTHSTFFSPIKYGILPQALPKSQLVAANGLFEATTFLGILLGTMYGGVMVLRGDGPYIIGFTCMGLALFGLLAAYFIPQAKGVDPKLNISRNFLAESWRVVKQAHQGNGIIQSLLFISWFWLLGGVLLSLIPVYGAQVLHGDEMTTTLLLSLFSIGIAVGSILCQKILGDKVTLAYLPFSAIVISLSGFAMVALSPLMPAPTTEALRTIPDLLSIPLFWPIMVAFIALALAGGIFTVPLYAYIQTFGEAATKSRLIAANNVLNAVFIVAGAIASSALLALGVSLLGVIAILMVANFIVALLSYGLMPHTAKQRPLKALMRTLFRVEVINAHYLDKLPKRTLVIANHQSFVDAALIAIFVPTKLTFAIDVNISKKWWVKPFLSIVKAFPLDTENPYAIRNLINLAKTGEPCMVFPEGRLTKTGALMKVYDGTAMVAVNADTHILPIFIRGAEFSKYTRLKGVLPQRWFPKITLTIHAPHKLPLPDDLRGRARRVAAGQLLQREMVDMHFASAPLNHTLFSALITAADTYGHKTRILSDPMNNAATK
ncbi:MAG: acyl-[ACP]--phospholipid O-acyltransferase, partial [Pseudomonas fluorescens]